jgi:phenylalanine-4-hydroxylase
MSCGSVTQAEVLESLPAHLRPFVKRQDHAAYTPRDHAVWRFVMRHLTRQLRATAHPVYLEGLERTGISLDHVPSIDEMNACLDRLGWRAVVVDGFIPPAIFMEFQALKVLVIALEMRSVEHMLYTPAPDILHESAGHAPFIVDIDYAEFLQRFGEVGMKAIATQEDLDQYEAIRKLSILKECPDTPAREIAAAEAELERLSAATSEPSEAALLTRLHWWTVEYGLVGTPDDYRIFGAGLLSSLGESRRCLDDAKVRKIPLTVNAVKTPYDITREQPQLFVTRSCKHLTQVLEEFAASMSFMRGGAASLERAVRAGSICTARYNTGVQISGVFRDVRCDAVGNATYLRTSGPTQIAYRDQELLGHGVDTHAQGFGSPVGRLKDFSRCLSDYTVDELRAHDIVIGERVKLEYLSGITVEGELEHIVRKDQKNLLLSFRNCLVVDLEGEVLFDPQWGSYDLAVGAAVDSVYGGVADRAKLQLFKATPRSESVPRDVDDQLMSAYAEVAALREAGVIRDETALPAVVRDALEEHPREWLLRSELLGVAEASLREVLVAQLRDLQMGSDEAAELIGMALELS